MSVKRGSSASSGRPIARHSSAQYRSGWRKHRVRKRSSPQRKFPTSGLGIWVRDPGPGSRAGWNVPCSADITSDASIHIAVPRSETSTTDPSPVRSLRNSAAAIPNASCTAPLRSPSAPRCPIGSSSPMGVSVSPRPPRAQNAVESYAGVSASGPRAPYPWPRA